MSFSINLNMFMSWTFLTCLGCLIGSWFFDAAGLGAVAGLTLASGLSIIADSI